MHNCSEYICRPVSSKSVPASVGIYLSGLVAEQQILCVDQHTENQESFQKNPLKARGQLAMKILLHATEANNLKKKCLQGLCR